MSRPISGTQGPGPCRRRRHQWPGDWLGVRMGRQRPWLVGHWALCAASRLIRRRPAAVEGGIAILWAEGCVALNRPVHGRPDPFGWTLVPVPWVLFGLRPVVVESPPVGTLRLFLCQRRSGNQMAVHASHWRAGARAGCRLFLEFDGRHVNPESRFKVSRWGVREARGGIQGCWQGSPFQGGPNRRVNRLT